MHETESLIVPTDNKCMSVVPHPQLISLQQTCIPQQSSFGLHHFLHQTRITKRPNYLPFNWQPHGPAHISMHPNSLALSLTKQTRAAIRKGTMSSRIQPSTNVVLFIWCLLNYLDTFAEVHPSFSKCLRNSPPRAPPRATGTAYPAWEIAQQNMSLLYNSCLHARGSLHSGKSKCQGKNRRSLSRIQIWAPAA